MKLKNKVLGRLLKVTIWIAGFLSLFFIITEILQPKYLFRSESESPETEMWDCFYEEPKESLDILFLGSSHIYNAVNPVVFYEETGLRGFNMSSSSQDLPTSYFYLKEALRHHKPKYVMMDSYGIFYQAFEDSVCYTRSLDNMKWSSVKAEAVKHWQKHLKTEKMFNRIFTITDFHTRWESLTKQDFVPEQSYSSFCGYCPYFEHQEDVQHIYFQKDAEVSPLDQEALKYFDKIVKLCREEGIEIHLCSVPDATWSKNHAEHIQKLSEEYQIPFIDYNEEQIYAQIGIEDDKDWRDAGHLNTYGATKFSSYLAKTLLEKEIVEKREVVEEHWNNKIETWKNQFAREDLCVTQEIVEYLNKLKNPEYSIFMTVKDEGMQGLNDSIIREMKRLGLSGAIYGKLRQSYYAIISEGQILEKVGEEKLSVHGKFAKDLLTYDLVSAGYDCGNFCQIRINDQEYAQNKRGLNIVVYDHVSEKVIDSVVFDTHNRKITAVRK